MSTTRPGARPVLLGGLIAFALLERARNAVENTA